MILNPEGYNLKIFAPGCSAGALESLARQRQQKFKFLHPITDLGVQ